MKSFKSFLNEEIMPFAQIEKGVVGIDNDPVRDAINNHLTAVTERSFTTPYIALESVRKVLSSFHIFIPATNFMDGNSGYEAFKISQFGSKSGMTNDGDMVVNATSPFYVYFEYQSNQLGGFEVFCQVINDEELNEILNDVESDLNDDEEEDDDEELNESNKENKDKKKEWIKKQGGKLKDARKKIKDNVNRFDMRNLKLAEEED